MKSIERRFKEVEVKEKNPSTFMNFGKAIIGQNFSHKTIAKQFNRLVDLKDYLKSEERQLLEHLDHLTKLPEEVAKMKKFELKGTPFIKVMC